jgi:hypothetical protein
MFLGEWATSPETRLPLRGSTRLLNDAESERYGTGAAVLTEQRYSTDGAYAVRATSAEGERLLHGVRDRLFGTEVIAPLFFRPLHCPLYRASNTALCPVVRDKSHDRRCYSPTCLFPACTVCVPRHF